MVRLIVSVLEDEALLLLEMTFLINEIGLKDCYSVNWRHRVYYWNNVLDFGP